jgi:hypothetical protein
MNWREANRKIIASTTRERQCRPGLQPKFVICRRDFNPEKDKIPAAGTLEPGNPVPFNLLMESGTATINGPLVFSCIEKGLTLDNSKLVVNADLKGTLNLENSSTALFSNSSFNSGLRISLQDHNSWIYFDRVNPWVLPDYHWTLG